MLHGSFEESLDPFSAGISMATEVFENAGKHVNRRLVAAQDHEPSSVSAAQKLRPSRQENVG
jgi:hypothetical protein